MATLNFQVGASSMVGYTPAADFTFSIAETPATQGGTWTYAVSYKDSVVDTLSSYTADNNFRVDVATAAGFPNYSVALRSGGAYATLSGNSVSRVADGQVIVDITSHYGTKSFTRTMLRSSASGYKVYNAYISGSLAKHVVDQINTWLSGQTPGSTAQNIYNSGYVPNATTPSGSRNTSLFIGTTFDFSAVSFCTGGTNRDITNYPGMLVTPRHALMAKHTIVECPVTKVCWMLQGGAFVTANVVSTTSIGTDLGIIYLDRDVNALGVPIMQVGSTNLITKLSTLAERPYGLPCLIRDTQTGAGNIPTTNVLTLTPHIRVTECKATNGCVVQSGFSPTYTNWMSMCNAGDSSSPVFLPINGVPVLLWMAATAVFGDDISSKNTEINTAMRALAAAQGDNTAYAVTNPDLSAFTVY